MEVLPDLFEKDLGIQIEEWEILGPLGLVIQGILGVMSLSALLVKRYFEEPKRPVKIWLLDTSKQVLSASLVHCLNMALSTLLSESSSVTDNCEWYFINFAVDVAFGTFLNFIILKTIENFAAMNGIDALNTGVYVHIDYTKSDDENMEPTQQEVKHRIDYKIWFLQVVVWNWVVVIVKIILVFTIKIFASLFEIIADILLGWLKKYPDLKLVLIMIIVPIILNSIQFWVQDNILKGKKENIKKRWHAQKLPAKLGIDESGYHSSSKKDKLNQSVSEYFA